MRYLVLFLCLAGFICGCTSENPMLPEKILTKHLDEGLEDGGDPDAVALDQTERIITTTWGDIKKAFGG